MPSGQDYASRLRDEARRAMAAHVSSFEQEFRAVQQNLSSALSALDQIAQRLSSAHSVDFSAVEKIVADAFAQAGHEAAQSADADKSFLAHFAYEIRRKETQEEILNLLLDGAHRYAPRLALLVARGEEFVGWSTRGFPQGSGPDLDKYRLSASQSPLLRDSLAADGLATANDLSRENTLTRLLPAGTELEGPWHAFPLRAIHHPVAILLAMAADGRTCDLEPLCILMDLTGLCVENVALRILQQMHAAAASGPEPQVEEAVPAPPAVAPEPAVAEEVPEPPQSTVVAAIEAMPAAESAAPVAETSPVEEVAAIAPDVPVEVPAPVEEPEVEAITLPPHVGVEVEPSHMPEVFEQLVSQEAAAPAEPVQVEEPAPVASRAKQESKGAAAEKPEHVKGAALREVQPLSEDEKLHADAKRFARLLATEIKLYNEQRVKEGRARRDIYERLKRDIDRSRDMYEKRVSPTVARKVDYFHDEIVRVLGDNDPSTLGSDYPGPRVES